MLAASRCLQPRASLMMRSATVRAIVARAPPLVGCRAPFPASGQRGLAHATDPGENNHIHFRLNKQPHPLLAKPFQQADYDGRYASTPNHIWSEEEVNKRLENLWQHTPQTISDRVMHFIVKTLLYKSFNKVTGFRAENTDVKSVQWRLIVLESFAGVPGFMAAMFRHFRSLRTLQRDHGWIHTLLEEAENERMHLLVCMKMFEVSLPTRIMVMGAQLFMTPFLAALYLVKPAAVHRFVGYLEETACVTYANVIHQVETPGTPLHEAWSRLPAPALARQYWLLPADALWVDALKCMFADESNHRDVNHTFAIMQTDDPNPFIEQHKQDAVHAWRLQACNQTTDLGCSRTLGKRAP